VEKAQELLGNMQEGVAEGGMYGDEPVSWEKGGRRAPTGAFRPAVVKTNKPIGTRVSDIGPGGKEYNVKTDQEWDKQKGVAEGGPYDLPGKDYDRPGDMPRKQSSKDHNPYPYSPEQDDDYFREIFRKKREADKAKAQSGSLNELSTPKLAQYKTAAAVDAKKSDAAGNYAQGDRRFRGINQATIKQFANDAKTHASTVKEQSSAGSDAVEQAILKRIMVSHTDLLMQFGPEKVMQAAEEVAYNAGDVDEIGTSDVSAYVRQVRQILGAE
jgi:hypothetical protein